MFSEMLCGIEINPIILGLATQTVAYSVKLGPNLKNIWEILRKLQVIWLKCVSELSLIKYRMYLNCGVF